MTQAREFEIRMQRIWDGDLHELYDLHHNAHHEIREAGATRTGGGKKDGRPSNIWMFPDGSKLGVFTSGDGVFVPLREVGVCKRRRVERAAA